jgi:hypothetical protein
MMEKICASGGGGLRGPVDVDRRDDVRSGLAQPAQMIIESTAVPFICKSDLIECKQQAGRLRDLADVEELQALGDVFTEG